MKRFFILGLVTLTLNGCDNTDYKKQAEPPLTAEQTDRIIKAVVPPVPVESKKDYLASTKKIGSKKSDIYYKEFLKNSGKFNGERVNIRGQIMSIEEADNQTVIQIQITERLDSIIAHYPGSVKVYQGDWITVYGEGKGTFEGKNRMGASMTWPIIAAKYVVKHSSGE